jgi:predicted RNA binding protein YcfA (HicA-like mRNA interferase family)
MKPVSGREFTRILERHGWRLLRIKGSHHVYGKPGVRAKLSVPVHGGHDLKVGLQAYFMRVADLRDEDLS